MGFELTKNGETIEIDGLGYSNTGPRGAENGVRGELRLPEPVSGDETVSTLVEATVGRVIEAVVPPQSSEIVGCLSPLPSLEISFNILSTGISIPKQNLVIRQRADFKRTTIATNHCVVLDFIRCTPCSDNTTLEAQKQKPQDENPAKG